MRFRAVSSVPLFFLLAAFVISCSAGLSAIEGLQPLGLVPETGLHGLGLAWPQTSWTGLSITARGLIL